MQKKTSQEKKKKHVHTSPQDQQKMTNSPAGHGGEPSQMGWNNTVMEPP